MIGGRRRSGYPRLAAAATASGCLLLVARPLIVPGGVAAAQWVTTALFVTLLGFGLVPVGRPAVPADAGAPGRVPLRLAVLTAGIAAFAAGSVLAGDPGLHVLPRVAALVVLAAVAEEAFFRGLVYGTLAGRGESVALAGSATLFALVHVTVYGWWVLPLDLAAGLVLSWQRWATGTWTVPAAAHVAANLLVLR